MVHHVDNVSIIIQTSKTQINAHTDVDKPHTSAIKKTWIVTIKNTFKSNKICQVCRNPHTLFP